MATAPVIIGGVPPSAHGAVGEPDPDTIKMFVGQIPRHMEETELRKMFEEFGSVHQLNVLRDKATGQSKGCCFVTFHTRKAALEAQNALHNIKTMAGMHHPIQMKPADSENRNVEERKLFIGMLSKKCPEKDVRNLFAPYGAIEECTVLRDSNGQSRGCAFVTYATRQCAHNAIKTMHHSQTMEGCSSPLVVKFADTQKEKEAKKLQTQITNLWQMSSSLGPGTTPPASSISPTNSPQYLALLQQAIATGNFNLLGNNYSGLVSQQQNSFAMQQLLAAAAAAATGSPPAITNGGSALGGAAGTMTGCSTPNSMIGGATANSLMSGATAAALQSAVSATSLSSPPVSMGSLQAAFSNSNALAAAVAAASMNGLAGTGLASTNGTSGIDAITQAYSGIQQYAATFPNAFQPALPSPASPAGKQIEGPDGANLFIYHLPQEFTDQDLTQTFMPFGNVISAKVFIDKQTKMSKCFGFVSYDNALSAQAAIQAMNGFQIGMKRLKVQLKRPKNESKPY